MKSETSYLIEAVRSFLPDSEFSFENDDYSTIVFTKIEGDAPSAKEIDNQIKLMKKRDEELAAQAESKKQSILEKLNLSEEEFRAIFA